MWKNNPNVPSHQPDWFCRSCGFPNGMTSLDVPILGAVLNKQHTASGVIFFWRSLNRDLSEVKIAQHQHDRTAPPHEQQQQQQTKKQQHQHQHKQEPGQKLVTLPIIYVSRDRRHTYDTIHINSKPLHRETVHRPSSKDFSPRKKHSLNMFSPVVSWFINPINYSYKYHKP